MFFVHTDASPNQHAFIWILELSISLAAMMAKN